MAKRSKVLRARRSIGVHRIARGEVLEHVEKLAAVGARL
jgi:hypothetical protein